MITLSPKEHIILVARKHWFILIVEIASVLIATSIAIFLVIGAETLLPDTILQAIGTDRLIAFNAFFLSLLILFSLMSVSVMFTNFYLDLLLVTNKQLVDCDQRRLFFRDVAVVPIRNIIDVKAETQGIIQTFLHYGTIHVQTAGETKEVIVRGVARPFEVKDTIMRTFQTYSTDLQHLVQPTEKKHAATTTTTAL